jgi:hypothetical protein
MVARKFCISTTSVNIKMRKHVDRIHGVKSREEEKICANFEMKQGTTSRDKNNRPKVACTYFCREKM